MRILSPPFMVYGTKLNCDGTAVVLVLLRLSMEISIISAYSRKKGEKTSLLVTLDIMLVMLLLTSIQQALFRRRLPFKYYVSLVSDYIDPNMTALSVYMFRINFLLFFLSLTYIQV